MTTELKKEKEEKADEYNRKTFKNKYINMKKRKYK
jgi:hypothetical protein